jgi:hypothetical protein
MITDVGEKLMIYCVISKICCVMTWGKLSATVKLNIYSSALVEMFPSSPLNGLSYGLINDEEEHAILGNSHLSLSANPLFLLNLLLPFLSYSMQHPLLFFLSFAFLSYDSFSWNLWWMAHLSALYQKQKMNDLFY